MRVQVYSCVCMYLPQHDIFLYYHVYILLLQLRDFIVTVMLLIEPVQNNSTYETVANEIVEFERNLSFVSCTIVDTYRVCFEHHSLFRGIGCDIIQSVYVVYVHTCNKIRYWKM